MELSLSYSFGEPSVISGRGTIVNLEDAINQLEDPAPIGDKLTHHFAPGCYGREIFMPAGSTVVGKIHKHAHLNVLLEGRVTVATPTGKETFDAPRVWVSEPGTKRAVYNHTDVRWITFHPTDETDLEKIEEHVIAPSFQSYDKFIEQQRTLIAQESDL